MRLGGTTDIRLQCIQDEDLDSRLAKTGDDEENAHTSGGVGWEAVLQCPSLFARPPQCLSTKIPSDTSFVGSNLGKTHWGFGSRAFVGIVITDSVLEAGGSSPSAGGSAVVVPVVKVSMGCALGLGAQCL